MEKKDSMIFYVLTLTIISIYAACGIVFIFALLRRKTPSEYTLSPVQPPVTVIVPARNEEQTIQACIAYLQALRYPAAKTEIIIVDDNSTDSTVQRAQAACSGDVRFRLIHARQPSLNLNGKANAIDTAIQEAKGEFVLVTDADCRVPPHWIEAHLRHYGVDTCMVGGYVVPRNEQPGRSLFAELQRLDWLYLCTIGAASACLGIPLSVFGNNASFRRQAYLRVGGYAGLPFSLIEDYALMHAIRSKAAGGVVFSPDAALLVHTLPAPGWRDFFKQRLRWVVGARDVDLPALLVLVVGFCGRVWPLVCLLSARVFWGLFAAVTFAGVDLLLVLCAGLLLRRCRSRDNRALTTRNECDAKKRDVCLRVVAVVLFPIFTCLYSVILVPLYFFSKKVDWKQRAYMAR